MYHKEKKTGAMKNATFVFGVIVDLCIVNESNIVKKLRLLNRPLKSHLVERLSGFRIIVRGGRDEGGAHPNAV